MNKNQEIKYCVFTMYGRKACSFLKIDATNLDDAITEARWEYNLPNILLMDQFGNQYVIRMNHIEQPIIPKGLCVTLGNRSCLGCYFKAWGGCAH